MDVLYHRNCLDGVYAAYLIYLFSRIAELESVEGLVDYLRKYFLNSPHRDMTSHQPQEPIVCLKQQDLVLTEEWFHSKSGVSYNSYSLFAGQFIEKDFPGKHKILLVVDTNLGKASNILLMAKNYELVLVIDHHTSFGPMKKQLQDSKNVLYIWDQQKCASQLILRFLEAYFGFETALPGGMQQVLRKTIAYVGKNDLKKNEDRESKSFVLGFYYFGIELSHLNPLLFQRLGLFDLPSLCQKGRKLYKEHIQEIIIEVSHAKMYEFQGKGQLCKSKFLALSPANPSKISDFGTCLAYLSAKHGCSNLAVLEIHKKYDSRISCRSSRHFSNPLALTLAQYFQGGGHHEAAGFKTQRDRFRSLFKQIPHEINLNITVQEIQHILFGNELPKGD